MTTLTLSGLTHSNRPRQLQMVVMGLNLGIPGPFGLPGSAAPAAWSGAGFCQLLEPLGRSVPSSTTSTAT